MVRRFVAALLATLAPVLTAQASAVELPPADASYDSQLGGAYPPPPGTSVVSRDREDAPAESLYNICYVNAFQTQPQDAEWWLSNHPGLVLMRDGRPMQDANWPGEYLLDTSTSKKRGALLAIISAWIDGCAVAGFDAIEADNLDTYARSGGALSITDNLAFARAFIDHAHDLGLAAAQKNGVELGSRGPAAGFDFVITESCQVWDECGAYIEQYGGHVLAIEYTDTGRHHFEDACAAYGEKISVILRDRNLTSPGDPAYVYEAC